MRRWDLAHVPGDQAPPHRHHRSDEGFVVLRGRLEVLVGTTHTFATVDADGADVIAVMTPEIDRLVTALHSAATDDERPAVWERHHSAPTPAN